MDYDGDIATVIRAALAEQVKQDSTLINPDHDLRTDLGLDSVGIIELLYKLEEAFDLQIPDQDLGGLRTVEDVVTYIRRKVPVKTQRESVKSRRSSRRSVPSRKKPQR